MPSAAGGAAHSSQVQGQVTCAVQGCRGSCQRLRALPTSARSELQAPLTAPTLGVLAPSGQAPRVGSFWEAAPTAPEGLGPEFGAHRPAARGGRVHVWCSCLHSPEQEPRGRESLCSVGPKCTGVRRKAVARIVKSRAGFFSRNLHMCCMGTAPAYSPLRGD